MISLKGNLDVTLDDERQVIEIAGVPYDYRIFKELGGLMPLGKLFRLLNRADGVITIQVYEGL